MSHINVMLYKNVLSYFLKSFIKNFFLARSDSSIYTLSLVPVILDIWHFSYYNRVHLSVSCPVNEHTEDKACVLLICAFLT